MANSPFGGKADLWMPLDIGAWRRDTTHLNPTEKAAYLALQLYYWEHGNLPKDPARLANIAQVSLDTWSNTQEALSIGFFEDDSGVLHLAQEREKRARFALKRQKAREKAIKAITARWSKHRAKLHALSISTSDTPSISPRIPDEQLGELSVIHKSKDKSIPTPTPPTAREGIEPDTPSTPSTPSGPAAGKRNETKAKPPKKPVRTAAGTGKDGEAHPGEENGRAGPQRSIAGHSGKGSNADFRESAFTAEILHFWRDQNPEFPEYEFSGPDRRALRDLLEHHQRLSLEEFRRLLQNRANSEINPAASPHKWLRNIVEYSAGRLGKFGRRADAARSL